MSAEFRQRTPAEYARILWKRKWFIVLPAIAVFFAVATVVRRLPSVYQSTTLLIVKASTIPDVIVPQLSDEDLTIRINNIGQKVVSRTSLEPLIIANDLYAAERERGVPMDLLVEQMKNRDIQIAVNTSRNDITNGFYISFRAANPRVAQAVTSALSTMYVNEQVNQIAQNAGLTKDLIDQQVEQTKTELDDIDRRRLALMVARSESLPEDSGSLLTRLTGLYDQQKSINDQIAQLRNHRTALSGQLGDIRKQIDREVVDVAETITDPKTTREWADYSQQESQIETQLDQMLRELTPKNPDVVNLQQQLARVKGKKDALLGEWKSKIAEKENRLARRAENDPRIKGIEYNLNYVDVELKRQQEQLDQTRGQIAELDGRINKVPGTKVEFEQLNREFESTKRNYDQLVVKQQQVALSTQVAVQQQGESIQVLDPASLPAQPVAPKRAMLMGGGLAAGLALGLLLALVAEVPRLLTIQNVEDARHYTHLPVLAAVPSLMTVREQRRLRVRRVAFGFAAVVVTAVSIPALAVLLRVSHLFDRFTV
ncbi:MAG: GumC family protein [Pyrinomonadaceae bacterium]